MGRLAVVAVTEEGFAFGFVCQTIDLKLSLRALMLEMYDLASPDMRLSALTLLEVVYCVELLRSPALSCEYWGSLESTAQCSKRGCGDALERGASTRLYVAACIRRSGVHGVYGEGYTYWPSLRYCVKLINKRLQNRLRVLPQMTLTELGEGSAFPRSSSAHDVNADRGP